jgi:hypothetical protein
MAVTDLGAPTFALHPLHGMHRATQTTPMRLPRSVRRTSSIDMTRDEGAIDPVYLRGYARDLWTDADGTATEIGRASMTATAELITRVVRRIDTEPAIAGISQLVGGPAISGFRSAADALAPDLRRRRDLLYTLLDDFPVTTLISGQALGASGVLGEMKTGYLPPADQCAGFVSGGLLMQSFDAGEPAVVTGPLAPQLDGDDPLGWHPMAALPLHGMRRQRRLDVYHADDGPNVFVDAMFRDTYRRSDGQTTIIHEYTVAATVDPDSGEILKSAATPRVLPWQECPGAVDSATRIAGMTLTQLHERVRKELAGTTTCTHLNDLLRSLADTAALIPELRRRS